MTRVTNYDYLHNGRELELMQSGSKPMAAFRLGQGIDETDACSNQDFAPQIENGKLFRFDRTIEDQSGATHHYLIFTLPDQSWRAEAFCELMTVLHNFTWSPELELLEGRLYGYTHEQNMFHLKQKFGDQDFKTAP